MLFYQPIKAFDLIKQSGLSALNNVYCTKNFLWSELLINQTEIPTLSILNNLFVMAQMIQQYRDTLFNNSPVTITSGWRSKNYNKKIGGALNSYHTYGMALDFLVAGFTPEQVQKILDPIHKGGLEFASSWTHIDIRSYKARFFA